MAQKWYLKATIWCISVGFAASGLAKENNAGVNFLRNQYQQKEQQALELLKQQREQGLRREQAPTETVNESPNHNPDSRQNREPCLEWDNVRLVGLELLPASSQLALRQQAPNGCLRVSLLQQFAKQVSASFLEAGFFQIYLQQLEQPGRTLVWQVIPAKIIAIQVKGSLNAKLLFPGIIGKAANIRDLDQGLDQAERLPGRSVSMDLYPDEQGNFLLQLQDQVERRYAGVINANNLGQDSTGRNRIQASLSLANPLSLVDQLTLSVNSTVEHQGQKKRFSRGSSLFYSIPYGYWTGFAYAGYSEYRADTLLESGRLVNRNGDSWYSGFNINRVLTRSTQRIHSINLDLARLGIENRFENALLTSSSVDLTSLAISYQLTDLSDQQLVHWQLELKQGLAILGADHKTAGLPDPRYRKLSGEVERSRSLELGDQSLILKQRAKLQYGFASLPAAEELSVTHFNSGLRGFRNLSLSGDHGAFLRQSLLLNRRTGMWHWQPYMGLDAAKARYRDGPWQTALAVSAGIKIHYSSLKLEASAHRGKLFLNPERDKMNTELALNLSWFY